jgi:NAD(P)-dependent dehydrogenase (short-subunit alcohol dehydrogenase family)
MKAVVLGSSSGLGAFLAAHLRSIDWQVVGISRHPKHDDDVSLDLEAADASDGLEALLETHGPDLVVNCAVVYPDLGADRASTPSQVVRQMQRQFVVNAAVAYAAMDTWIQAAGTERACTYIHCSSDSVYAVHPVSAGYPASKLAAHALVNALAKRARGTRFAVVTLLLGPLATPGKLAELERIAAARQWSTEQATTRYLSRANPNYVQDSLIRLETCVAAVTLLHTLGVQANGTLLRLDAGAGGAGV